jgi:hypothetical protein
MKAENRNAIAHISKTLDLFLSFSKNNVNINNSIENIPAIKE